ncbi:TetR/AcrR family transcriptional regulator [Paenibacillus paeoniae]|uniref:TetR/AcrR family transcriptional regulator n=1 Tax=Paenibacillus paeoniae TaxID=2292705 RepID=A0A371PL60_9BACL|nr:TetR/AcrR family transcriptional regulator [Paenibacillus paeoniae]REK76936.1 TetR/AcrR family transcriptional regulator [Paenibacillus paeoniae]
MEVCPIKKKEVTSTHLIEVSFELFAQFGLEKTSLGMIAKAAGMTKSSIYYHYATKEDLISSTFDHMFSDHKFSTYFQTDLVTEDNFGDVLFQGGLNMLPKQDMNHRASLRVLNEFMTLAERDDQYRQRIMSIQCDFIEGFHRLVALGAEWGIVSSEHVEEKATLLALTIDHLSRCMMLKFELDYHALWREAVNSFLYRGMQNHSN